MISERLKSAVNGACSEAETPFYVIDLDGIKRSALDMIGAWRAVFPHFTLAYSYKTNCLAAVTEVLRAAGAAAEVVSGAELDAALADGHAPSSILFDGPVKRVCELESALEKGVSIQVDSVAEARLLVKLGAPRDARVALRLAVPQGRRNWSRFGLVPNEAEAARRVLVDGGLAIRGVHFNVGAHSLDARPYRAVIRYWATFLQRVVRHAAVPMMLDIGGGFPARSCFPGRDLPGSTVYAIGVAEECAAIGLDLSRIHLVIEPGRSLVEDHGVLVAGVAVVKQRGKRTVVALDAGTNLVRSLGLWPHPIEFVAETLSRTARYDVYGCLCYESDCFATNVPGPAALTEGHRVLVGAAGGYDIPSANVWTRPSPAIFGISEASTSGDIVAVRRAGSAIR